MHDSNAADITERVTAALACPVADEEEMLAHTRWQLNEMMTRVKPADLTPAEIVALLAVLMKPHARVLALSGGPPLRPLLHIVGDAAADLA